VRACGSVLRPEIAHPDLISPSVCLRIERSDPPPICVHPIADALRAVEPKRACRISVHPSIVARVTVLARTRAHSRQPFAFGCSELHRAPRVRSGAGVSPKESV
jgi:hypothetical protein